MRLRLPVLLIALAAAATDARPAWAQAVPDEAVGFWVTPSVRTSAVHEDNLLFTGEQRTAGTFLRVTPTVDANYRGPRTTVDLTYGFDSERHPEAQRLLNNTFARQAAAGGFESKPNPRLLVSGHARYITTIRPEEILDDTTGLLAERRRTTAYAGDGGFDHDITPRMRWHAGYAINHEDFGEPLPSRPSAKSTMHAVSTDLGFRIGPRTLLSAVYTGRRLSGDDIRVRSIVHGDFTAHMVAARLTRTLAPGITAVLLAGPRYSQTLPEGIPPSGEVALESTFAPEVQASFTVRRAPGRLSATYTRSQFMGYGAAGFIDTESIDVRAATVVAKRIELSARPALFRNTLTDVVAKVYRVDVAAGLRVTPWLSVGASYLHRYQDRTLTLADTVNPGEPRPRTRRSLFIGVTVRHAMRLDDHP